jgi:hypothetical protein
MRPCRLRSALALAALGASGLLAQDVQAAPARTAALERLTRNPFALIELNRARAREALPALGLLRARRLTPGLPIWRIRSAAAIRLLPQLERQGLVRTFDPDLSLRPQGGAVAGEPLLLASEWWLTDVGADRVTPPGPGVPLAVVDTGLDLSHPDFANRPDTVALDRQQVSADEGEYHGTAVSSVAAAPADGVDLVGVYPQALLQSWDSDGTLGGVIRGIDAASRQGPCVINLSLSTFDNLQTLADTVEAAVRRGSLIVAAAGNVRNLDSPAQYPADYPHVLTVGATTRNDTVARFSNATPFMDLVAPGEDIAVDVPFSTESAGYALHASGTSFSAPIVAAAAAWLWTEHPDLVASQVSEVLRTTARDLPPAGFDPDSGFGLLDLPAALAAAPPPPDPQEPNDDIAEVKPNGLFRFGTPILTGPGRSHAVVVARLDRAEDPYDVYRVWMPARGRLVATTTGTADVDVQAWRNGTRTVLEHGRLRDRDVLGLSGNLGSPAEHLVVRNRSSRAQLVYVEVFLGELTPRASYRLSLRVEP